MRCATSPQRLPSSRARMRTTSSSVRPLLAALLLRLIRIIAALAYIFLRDELRARRWLQVAAKKAPHRKGVLQLYLTRFEGELEKFKREQAVQTNSPETEEAKEL